MDMMRETFERNFHIILLVLIFSQEWRRSKEANFNPFNSPKNAQAVVAAVRNAVQGMSKLFC